MKKKSLGLTLVELLISFVIVSILLTQVFPGMAKYFRNKSIRHAADEIHMGLNLAKFEAIKRNNTVFFIPNKTGWSIQAVPEDGGANIVVAQRAAASNEKNLTVTQSNANVSFTGSGRSSIGKAFTMDITKPGAGSCADSGGDVRCMHIDVTTNGRIQLCDKALPNGHPRACA